MVESFVYVEGMNHAFYKPHQDRVVKSYSKMSVSYATNCKHQQQNQQTENTHRHTEKKNKRHRKTQKETHKKVASKIHAEAHKVSQCTAERGTERERCDAFRAGCGSFDSLTA